MPTFANPQQPNLVTRLLVIISVLMLIAGTIGMVLLQRTVRETSFDTRQQAAVSDGTVIVNATPPESVAVRLDTTTEVELMVNTQGLQIDGVQVSFDVLSPSIEVPTISTTSYPDASFQILASDISQITGGYRVNVVVAPANLTQPISTNSMVSFLVVSLHPFGLDGIQLVFDNNQSLATVANTDPPEDQLQPIPSVTYAVTSASPSPSPSLSPTPSPTPTPTPAPSVSPSPSPSVSPSPNNGVGGTDVKQCNEACTAHADCDVNLGCFDNKCRLATNVSSTTCVNPPDQGLQRQCNEYCANTGECDTGFTCLENRCRRPDNPDDTLCRVPSSTLQKQITESCNDACTKNADCSNNMRCYQGMCRLATNPGSTSCTAASVSRSTSDQKGSLATDIIDSPSSTVSSKPSPTATAVAKVKPSPSPSPTTAPTREEKTALDTVLKSLEDMGVPVSLLPWIALGLGLLGLLLVIISQLTKRQSRPPQPPVKPPIQPTLPTQPPPPMPPAPMSPPAGPPPSVLQKTAPPLAVTPPPITPARPITPPITPAPFKPFKPITPPPTPATGPTLPRTGSTMMERLREKGINPPGDQ